MSKFCGKCGAQVNEGAAFCGSCGASTQPASTPSPQAGFQPVAQPVAAAPTPPPAFQPVAQPTAAPGGPAASVAAAPAATGSSPWLKIVIVVVIILFAVGAMAVGGVIYVAHKVSQKAQEYKREVLGETAAPAAGGGSGTGTGSGSGSATAAGTGSGAAPGTAAAAVPGDIPGQASPAATTDGKASGFTGDACGLLSKEDVSSAIGVVVLTTAPTDGGCSYFAKGTSVSMTSKHAAAMMGAKGADKKTQGMFEQFAGAVGGSMPKNETSDNDRPDGTTVVLAFGIDTNEAEEQMKLNAKVLGIGGMGSIDPIDGIGDEAFSKADSMMFVRKGDKLIRIMYMSCPCGTEAIKPLAKQIAAHL